MASAVDVARYLIHLTSNEEEPEFLSPMRLQKLLYYVQGWALGALERPFFSARIEAWTHGPVVRDVYQTFKQYGNEEIPSSMGTEPESLSYNERAFIESVWAEYKKYSAAGLRGMTHSEAPWLNARGGLPEAAKSEAEIAHQSLMAFFRPVAQEKLIPGITLEDAYAGFEQFTRGQGRPAKEVFARIRARHAL